MQAFQGKTQTWEIAISIGTARRAEPLLGFNLLEPNKEPNGVSAPLLTHLRTNMIAFIDTLFVVCKTQADSAGISDEQFAEELDDADGATFLAARDAFFQEYVDFFRRVGHGDVAAAMEVQLKAIEATLKETWEQAQNVDVATPTRLKIQGMDLNGEVSKAIHGAKLTG